MKPSEAVRRLVAEYHRRKTEIKKRLKEFALLHKAADADIFAELSFCILTPQSKAVSCHKAISKLKGSGLLFKAGAVRIRKVLKGSARFHNKKAGYIVEARKLFTKCGRFDIKNSINKDDSFKAREWLVKNIKGMGYKEASHFLRNIGLGQDLAILDVHILKNLKKYGVIKNVPSSLTRKNYLEMEERMREFSRSVKIPLGELDLLFWALETGYIFK